MPASTEPRRTPGMPPVSAIVLAAGRSSRMGVPKSLVQIQAQSLLARVLQNLAASRVSEVVVVLGYEAARVEREVDLRGVRVVANRDYLLGMSTSIRAGLRAADPSAAAYLIVLGDQPFVGGATIDALLDAWMRRGTHILTPVFRGRRGNPVLVDRALAPEMDSITGDVGFRALFAERADEMLDVPVDDPGILFDVDTVDQVRSLETRLGSGLSLKEALTELVTGEPTRRE